MTKPTYDAPGGSGAFTSISIPAVSCATIRDFVMIAPTADRYKVRWSAIGDITDWPTPGTTDARTKQSGEQELSNKYGYVTGIVGDDFYAYVFQERAITKFTYIGGDVVFSVDRFAEDIGCWRLNRYDSTNNGLVFFESEWGYHMLKDDVIVPIGEGRVDNTYTPVA